MSLLEISARWLIVLVVLVSFLISFPKIQRAIQESFNRTAEEIRRER